MEFMSANVNLSDLSEILTNLTPFRDRGSKFDIPENHTASLLSWHFEKILLKRKKIICSSYQAGQTPSSSLYDCTYIHYTSLGLSFDEKNSE